jgi:hypothetical protein
MITTTPGDTTPILTIFGHETPFRVPHPST